MWLRQKIGHENEVQYLLALALSLYRTTEKVALQTQVHTARSELLAYQKKQKFSVGLF